MSQHRRVILHTCKPENDDGLPFRCACTQRLTAKEAQDSISRGEARWKKQLNVHAGLVDIRTELVLVKWQTPLQARSISAFDIERAYVDDSAAARRRIEAFPVENQICLARKCGKQGAMAIPFYKDFRRRLKKTGCSSFTFVQMIEYSAPTFSRWINGKGSITPERLADVRLCLDFVEAVSYTHLTLPTKRIV